MQESTRRLVSSAFRRPALGGILQRALRQGRRWGSVGILSLAAVGCTPLGEYVHNGFKVGPNFRRPAAPVAQQWIDANDMRVRSESPDDSHWWTVFNDPILNDLVQFSYRQNLTLREAGWRVLEARASLGIAVGEIFPQTQTANGDFTQRGVSIAVANRQATPTRFYSQWGYGFNLSWELDFWGRFRRAIESADEQLNASVENYDDVLVALVSDVAANYVQLRTLEQQLEYTKTNVGLQRETLVLAQARFRAGTTSELDLDQAQSTLSQTESQIPQLEIQIRLTANRLCTLLGIPPEDLRAKISPGAIPTAPVEVAVGIPADLLRRRPDVRREERNAAAQCAQIGVAEADFYPAITIFGTIGYSARHFADLFSDKAFNGSVGPSFQWNILNYGRILNNVRLQEARFQELVTRYQNTVLKANEEVENGLITFLRSQQQTKALLQSVEAAQKAVRVALVQYRNGLTDFNRVALLEQDLVSRQNLLAQAQGQIALGLIQVYKGLGGGWQIRCDDAAAACATPPALPAAALGAPAEALPAPRPAAPMPVAPKP